MGDPERQCDSNSENRFIIKDHERFGEAEKSPAIDKKTTIEDNYNSLDCDELCKLDKDDLFLNIDRPYSMVSTYIRDTAGPENEGDSAYEANRKCWPPPLVLITFTAVQIICYIVDIKTAESNSNNLRPIATLFVFKPKRRYELWRFLTYMFVHNGFTHLFTNILSQIFLGFTLETVHRWWRVTLVYLAGVLAGSMGSSLFTPRVSLAGASAGGFALITALVATIIMNWSEMEYGRIQLFLIFVFLALEYYFTDVARISNIAHVSGALAGFLIGIAVMWNLKEVWWEQQLKVYAVVLYLTLMGAGIAYHFLNPAYFG